MSEIEYNDIIVFQNKKYRTRKIDIPGYGPRTIAPASLNEVLMSDGEYVSETARFIDEQIFFFVDDARFNRYTASELAKLVEREVG